MSTEIKTNMRNADTWTRGLFILLFALLYSIAEVVLGAIVLYQFGSQLIAGRINDKLHDFSRGLTAYIYQLLQFFTYRSDLKPYPFSDWPSEGLEGEEPEEGEEGDIEEEPEEVPQVETAEESGTEKEQKSETGAKKPKSEK